MVYNKGTVSFDQYQEEFLKLTEKEDITDIIPVDFLQNCFYAGMDIDETLIEFRNGKK